jgi:hypothetical protein
MCSMLTALIPTKGRVTVITISKNWARFYQDPKGKLVSKEFLACDHDICPKVSLSRVQIYLLDNEVS